MDLADALGIKRGIVCAVGAGGKKSLIYHLAANLPGRIAVTATVQMAAIPDSFDGARIVAAPAEIGTRVAEETSHRVAFACSSTKPDRLAGLPPDLVTQIHDDAGFDITLVKADGARMRLLKAPKLEEPVLPPRVDTIVPVVSARVIGQPLSTDVAHRIDHISAITGLRLGDTIAPTHVATLLSSPYGALQHAGNAPVAPLINMVDTPELRAAAREAAAQALRATDRFDRVVLVSLRQPEPVVEVVRR